MKEQVAVVGFPDASVLKLFIDCVTSFSSSSHCFGVTLESFPLKLT